MICWTAIQRQLEPPNARWAGVSIESARGCEQATRLSCSYPGGWDVGKYSRCILFSYILFSVDVLGANLKNFLSDSLSHRVPHYGVASIAYYYTIITSRCFGHRLGWFCRWPCYRLGMLPFSHILGDEFNDSLNLGTSDITLWWTA